MKLFVFLLCFSPLWIWGQAAAIDWQDFSFGDPALTVKMPGKPLAQRKNLPEDFKAYIQSYDAYYIQDQGMVVTLTYAHYAGDITTDLEGAVEGTIRQWKSTGSTVEIKSTLMGNAQGRPGLQVKGLFTLEGKEHDFAIMAISEGAKLWQVTIVKPSADMRLKQVITTIVDSLTFDPKN